MMKTSYNNHSHLKLELAWHPLEGCQRILSNGVEVAILHPDGRITDPEFGFISMDTVLGFADLFNLDEAEARRIVLVLTKDYRYG